MLLALILVLAGFASWMTYWRLERLGSRARWAALARGLAWAAMGLLLADLSWRTTGGTIIRPLVLMDQSLSMTAAGGHWTEARDSALAWGEVQPFGDRGPTIDSLPQWGRSDLGPALTAAQATSRPIVVVTDGELTDRSDIPAEALARAGVRLFPRAQVPDLAIGRIQGPDRVTSGDTIQLEVEVRGYHGSQRKSALEVRSDERVLARQPVAAGDAAAVSLRMRVPSRGLPPEALLTVALVDGTDAEPRDDVRWWLVRVSPTPGIVLVANPADWDARFLFRALTQVAALPTKGYTTLSERQWRSMETLELVAADQVRRATLGADVLIVKGGLGESMGRTRARGVWLWPSGESGEEVIPGEWYAAVAAASPVAGAFLGLPVDSFPPLTAITPMEPGPDAWTGVTAQLARRGSERAILTGTMTGGVRRVTTSAEGWWRWAFRGGASDEAYRALVANTLSWLLGSHDSTQARARLPRPVAANGRPLVFEWNAPPPATPLPVTITGPASSREDTLRFDASGRAELWLPPGRYRYALAGGGQGLMAVETWSEEWLPRDPAIEARATPNAVAFGTTGPRRWPWLFLLAIISLAAEWVERRRLGLR
jgi:hypothetical protein